MVAPPFWIGREAAVPNEDDDGRVAPFVRDLELTPVTRDESRIENVERGTPRRRPDHVADRSASTGSMRAARIAG